MNMPEMPKEPKIFQKQITLGNVIQIMILIVGGAVGYNKLEWRITQLEQIKLETHTLLEAQRVAHESSVREFRESLSKLSEAVTRLTAMEEMRQRQTGKL